MVQSKRKAATATSASPEVEDRAAKRVKLPDGNPSDEETPETTLESGLRFLDQAKQAKDKRADPRLSDSDVDASQDEFPDYYAAVVMPLALDTIEAKLRRKEYPTLTTLESDVKRMVANAKSYNEKSSEIYADAERIRKMVSNYMSKINPAYKDPSYAAFPTPLPEEPEGNGEAESASERKTGRQSMAAEDSVAPSAEPTPSIDASTETGRVRPRSSRVASTTQQPAPAKQINGRPPSSRPTAKEDVPEVKSAAKSEVKASAKSDFAGKTFQGAQEQLVTDLIQLKDEDDQELTQPFWNLPNRKLTDYYALIKTPESLKRIEKKVRGVHGRGDATGVTAFKSWRAFEDHMSLIWRNAREYNEDGSDISKLADQLEAFFKSRLAEAKLHVQEPVQTNGDSGGTQRLKLKMSTAKSPDPPPQKIMLRVGGGGMQKPASPAPAQTTKAPSPSVTSSDASAGAPRNGVIPHPSQLDQGGINGQRSTSVIAKDNSNVSHTVPMTGAAATPTHLPPTTAQDASDALFSNVNISTHPGLKIARRFQLNVPPSPTFSQQSITISLPSTHYFLQIVPSVAQVTNNRQSKLFVTANGQRLNSVPLPPSLADPRRPLFEAKLAPGVNRIEVEMIAGPIRGAPKVGNAPEVEVEKLSIFANLLRP
ncbi:MAG: hypothetical protein M1832_004120 [Thelocarpon impressellum]|nr:MAG: hypothetical protein M1832_004120 [Thelocarpon impressellum]